MPKSKAKDSTVLTLRLEGELKDWLELQAGKSDRSVSWIVREIIKAAREQARKEERYGR